MWWDMTNVSHFFGFIFKTIKTTANNLTLVRLFFYLQNYADFNIFCWKMLFFIKKYTYRSSKKIFQFFEDISIQVACVINIKIGFYGLISL